MLSDALLTCNPDGWALLNHDHAPERRGGTLRRCSAPSITSQRPRGVEVYRRVLSLVLGGQLDRHVLAEKTRIV